MEKPKAPSSAALTLAVLVTSLALSGRSIRAQSPELERDIDFVRGIVEDLRFVDLAQHEVDQLRKQHTSPEDAKLLAQLDIEVSIQGAKLHPNRVTRRAMFAEAIEQAGQLVERYAGEPVAHDARRTLVESCIEFGQFLNEELELAREEAEDPDAITGLEQAAADVFRRGVKAANAVQETCADRGEDTRSFVAWMQRGILYREHARAVPKDRTYLADQAITTLEDLILEVGEETALGQRALFEMAMVAEVLGKREEAIQSYTDAIDAIWIALTGEYAADLPEEVQRLMFDMMQEIYDRLARVCLADGQPERVQELVEQVGARIKEFRTEPHPVFGDSLALTQARALASSSREVDVSAALRKAKAINARHPIDFIGMRAKNLIRDILASSTDLVTGDLLFEVAKGSYQAKEYDAAIAGFKRALNRMDAESRSRLGFECWNLIGRANEQMRRFLEATLAYSRALRDHASDVNEADADDLGRTATRAAYCLRKVLASAKDPVPFHALKVQIDQQLAAHNPEIATANDYSRGLKAKSERKYQAAAKLFFSIEPDFDKYELALAHGILSLYHADQFDQAMEWIGKLRKRTAEHDLAEDERAARAYRAQALAWAHYAEGRIGYARATDPQGDRDPTAFPRLIRHFETFEATHARHADNLLPVVHDLIGRLHIMVGDPAKARERYETLKAMGKTVPNAHRALGLALFDHFTERVDALETELQVLESARKPADATERKLTTVRKQAVELGIDFAKTVHPPTYPVLYNLMRLAEDLEDWRNCEWAAEKILALYGKSKRASLEQVRPVLGQALLHQSGRLQEAYDVFVEAEKQWAGDESKTSSYYEVLRGKALALGGWPAFDESGINYRPNPGLGKPDEAYEILWLGDYRKYALNSKRTAKYSLEWYRYYLELYYICRQAQPIDSQFEQRAETLYNIARSTDNFATLRNLGSRGRRLESLFRQVGY